ncbi:PorP/SprF family type IX secretion system membrane protein [Echinicola vietnamensis]|uniref:Bacteroidetes-specific putative membrane protein n=1 Tax=Echinicola vietnamensis (strain DSM 17526 / LMG 23754 / KMM 6221) TaxID=926556 RepID=L0FUX2_ECHVK|nr:type IX secretion system membrane protein PorP/SprF [Echinicola vietnamensis]AGA76475.1 Bacteroidetes-specific putative membrane protein [Echinicola vietnamensis DSM 17526]
MGNVIKFMLWVVVVFTSVKTHAQQLPQFSQYIFNGLHINPGYAGYKEEGYIQATYRSQWVNFPGAPRTLSASADFSANEGTMGFGVSFLRDQLGPSRTTGALLTYAYRIQTGFDSFLGLGVSAGISDYRLDYDMLEAIDPDDRTLGEGVVNVKEPNVNVGIFYNTANFYAGISAFNVVGNKAFENQGIVRGYHDFHYYLTAGALLPMSDNVSFKPSFLVKEVKGAPTSFDLNALFLFYERLWVGGSYRSNTKFWKDNLQENLSNRNALAFILEVFATEDIRVGYAYDHSINVLNNRRNNSHELSLGYYLSPKRVRMRNQRWF